MKKAYPLFIVCLILILARVEFAQAESTVNATVGNPVITSAATDTPTPTSSSNSTPTPTVSLSPSPTLNPSLSPSPTLGPSSTPVPTGEENNIPKLTLDLSGFVSPFASIVMTSDDKFIRSTSADKDGNFSLSQIEVKKGFSSFCLEVVDFKRVGDSQTCFKIAPVTTNTTKTNIFLPPTIGLTARKIGPKATSVGFGYGMPGSEVTVHISDSVSLTAVADQNGLYKVEIKNLKPGTYSLFATAKFYSKNSEVPNKRIQLESLSAAGGAQEQLRTLLGKIWNAFVRFFKSYGWFVIPAFILLIILLVKRFKKRILKAMGKEVEEKDVNGPHLHHYWMLGY